MKLDDKDLESIARGRTRRTLRSRIMWGAVLGIIAVWLLAMMAIYGVSIAVYHCAKCAVENTNIAGTIGLIIFCIMFFATVTADNRGKNRLLDKIKKVYSRERK